MSNRNHLKKKAAAGTILVALSGLVPQPFVQHAQAATATISVTGSFISGITLGAGTDVKFGKLVATDINGTAKVATGGAVTLTKGVAAGGAPQAGSFTFKAANTTPNVDITVAGLGAMVLAATGGGAAAVGTAKLTKVILGGIGAAATTIADGGGGTGKKAAYDITKTTDTIDVGAIVSWGATTPIGSFAEAVVLTISY